MFSHVSVCQQSASWILGHCSALLRRGWYASYWNAFLSTMFQVEPRPSSHKAPVRETLSSSNQRSPTTSRDSLIQLKPTQDDGRLGCRMSNTYEKVTFSVLLLTLNGLIAELDVIERCKERCDQVNVSIHRLPLNF